MEAKKKTSMDILRDLRLKDLRDPRPWYEKLPWPHMRHGQKIKIVSAPDGSLLEGKETFVHTIAAKWIRRLSSTVYYDLKKKLFVFQEMSKHDIAQGERDFHARVRGYRDQKGEWLPYESQDERVTRGDYLLVEIELFTPNWPRVSSSVIEDNILHELLHVVRPSIGHFMKNGVSEDETFMHKTTRKLIRSFDRLSKSEINALLEHTERNK